MNLVLFDRINALFYSICVLATLVIIVSWIQRYSRHSLSSSIDMKNYFDSASDVQPVFSICAVDPKLKEKIEELAPGHNNESYLEFLRGNVYYEELRRINFNNLKFNWSEYFYRPPSAYLVGDNGIKLGRVPESKYWKSYTSYTGLLSQNRYLSTCIAIEPLSKHVHSVTFLFNKSIFYGSKRPKYRFRVYLHYPQQIMRSYSTVKYMWNELHEKPYQMLFSVQDIEVLQRHKNIKCNCIEDWKNYDKLSLEKHLKEVGCRAPYHDPELGYEICSDKKNIRKTLLYPSDIIMKRFDNPCRSLEKANYKYLETILDRIPNDTFEMKFKFNSRYKEIVQHEQVDLEVSVC